MGRSIGLVQFVHEDAPSIYHTEFLMPNARAIESYSQQFVRLLDLDKDSSLIVITKSFPVP